MKKLDKIYIDMDGVLADFDGHFKQLFGVEGRDYEKQYGQIAFWEKVYECPTFFRDLPPFYYYATLIMKCKEVAEKVVILSSPSRTNRELCVIQKRQWVDTYIGPHFPAIFDSKKHTFAGRNRLLIDDTKSKVDNWIKAGGIGYLFKDFDDCMMFLERWPT